MTLKIEPPLPSTAEGDHLMAVMPDHAVEMARPVFLRGETQFAQQPCRITGTPDMLGRRGAEPADAATLGATPRPVPKPIWNGQPGVEPVEFAPKFGVSPVVPEVVALMENLERRLENAAGRARVGIANEARKTEIHEMFPPDRRALLRNCLTAGGKRGVACVGRRSPIRVSEVRRRTLLGPGHGRMDGCLDKPNESGKHFRQDPGPLKKRCVT